MHPRQIVKCGLVSSFLFVITFGCPQQGLVSMEGLFYKSLNPFKSTDEFQDYLEKVRTARSQRDGNPLTGCMDAPSAQESADAPDQSITNIQEQGVDEGDIVKASGDFLIVLRRGRLFVVDVGADLNERLQPISRIDAYPKGFTQGDWYDEMLVHNDRIIVIGYSYEVGATEVGLFSLAANGTLTHKDTYFLRSNDYYSVRNYTGRLVGDTLILYMPYSLFQSWGAFDGGNQPSLPALKKWETDNQTTQWQDILTADDIHRPVQPTLHPTAHTIVQCDLKAKEFKCRAKAIIGPYARSYYVAPDAVYLWVTPGHENWDQTDDAKTGVESWSYLYRLPIRGGEAKAIRVAGQPVDQFSFKESDDGYLNVMVVENGLGDAMGGPEFASGHPQLLRVPLELFAVTPATASQDDYTELRGQLSNFIHNRFVGQHLLYGEGNGWSTGSGDNNQIYVVNYVSPASVHKIELGHTVERIEALGDAALAVGVNERSLYLSSLDLDQATLTDTFIRDGATQGETRSHGFFFKENQDGGGVLGLPVRLTGRANRNLNIHATGVLYLQLDGQRFFSQLGLMEAQDSESIRDDSDSCMASCTDWYGNARPIFFNGRIFALLGYELVEGELENEQLNEIDRTNFFLEATVPAEKSGCSAIPCSTNGLHCALLILPLGMLCVLRIRKSAECI